MPISYPVAALGGELPVPTLDGQANLRVPPGTVHEPIYHATHGSTLAWVEPDGGTTAFPWVTDGRDARTRCWPHASVRSRDATARA